MPPKRVLQLAHLYNFFNSTPIRNSIGLPCNLSNPSIYQMVMIFMQVKVSIEFSIAFFAIIAKKTKDSFCFNIYILLVFNI